MTPRRAWLGLAAALMLGAAAQASPITGHLSPDGYLRDLCPSSSTRRSTSSMWCSRKLQPGDSFAVARVDTASFTEKDIVAMVNFDDRPSVANRQKRDFRDVVSKFVNSVKASSHTDITGGMLQAIEHLDEVKPGHKTILIFSDLKEDLEKGYVRDIPLDLKGFDVVALNVTKLTSDNIDPREYMGRLKAWQQRVERGGGHWRVINDLENLDGALPG